jgi:pectate lyase
MPRTRRGNIHVVNDLFTSAGNNYCTNAGHEAHLLVENNVYQGVNNPLKPDDDGDMLERGNVFTDTSGTMSATGTGFAPPYSYAVEATAGLADLVKSGAGPH